MKEFKELGARGMEQGELIALEQAFRAARTEKSEQAKLKEWYEDPAQLKEWYLEALETAKHPGLGKLERYTLQVRRMVLSTAWASAALGLYGKDGEFSWRTLPVEVPFDHLLIITMLTGVVLLFHFRQCAIGDIKSYESWMNAQREKIRDKCPPLGTWGVAEAH